jgi:hypothetical protein
MKYLKHFESNIDFDKEEWEEEKRYRFTISIGDWSIDGHEKYDMFVFEANYPVETLQQSYKDSCKLTGIQFNSDQNYTGLPELDRNIRNKRLICTEYAEGKISDFAKKSTRRTRYRYKTL